MSWTSTRSWGSSWAVCAGFERDGNLVRLGGSLDGAVRVGQRATLSLNAAYEYGVVYSEEFDVDPTTGVLDVGDVVARHPTTLQAGVNLRAPLNDRLELIGRAQYYKVKSETTEATSLTPVSANSRLTFMLGLRFRHD